MTTIKQNQTSAPPQRDTPRKWNDPTYWKGVRIGQCTGCKRLGKDVLRNGLCWLCDSLRMWNSDELRAYVRKHNALPGPKSQWEDKESPADADAMEALDQLEQLQGGE